MEQTPDATAQPASDAAVSDAAVAADPVTAALARLDEVGSVPLERRPDVFHEIHENLRVALAAIDDA